MRDLELAEVSKVAEVVNNACDYVYYLPLETLRYQSPLSCHTRLLCLVLASGGVLIDQRDNVVERYKKLVMHTLQLGVYKRCRSLEGLWLALLWGLIALESRDVLRLSYMSFLHAHSTSDHLIS